MTALLRMRMRSQIFILLIAVAGLLLAYISSAPLPQGSTGEASIGGAFALTDMQGRHVTDADFHGKYTLVYLGYTGCPDMCPAMLSVLSTTLKSLGGEGDKFNVLFISLDPEKDTPAVLKEYLAAFDHRILGLTGSRGEVERVVHAYKAYAKAESASGSGAAFVNHSGLLYLMDKQGRYLRHFDAEVKADTLLQVLKAL